VIKGWYGLPLIFFVAVGMAGAEDWYISNAAGMALEPAFSRLALREKYALSVETVQASELPPQIRRYYNAAFLIERRILYETGEESRREWIFRDAAGKVRLNAVLLPPPSSENAEDEESSGAAEEPGEPSGFIEIYNGDNLIVEEHRLGDDGSDEIINYTYTGNILIRTRFSFKPPPSEDGEGPVQDMWTDYYRYSRFSSLRGINRVYHNDVPPTRLRFPHMVLDVGKPGTFIRPNDAYSSVFLEDVFLNRGESVVYTTDSRGRILTETRYDEAGEVIGEIQNTWSEDNNIQSVHWLAGEDERLVEYTYDDEGDRIEERNYMKGVLERVVQVEGEREIETLYLQGRPILRAIWEGGRKISEDQIRSRPGGVN
jgi:YD repeat-containing protein